jgi:parvulin-like peptidyl-prolyl isomerase
LDPAFFIYMRLLLLTAPGMRSSCHTACTLHLLFFLFSANNRAFSQSAAFLFQDKNVCKQICLTLPEVEGQASLGAAFETSFSAQLQPQPDLGKAICLCEPTSACSQSTGLLTLAAIKAGATVLHDHVLKQAPVPTRDEAANLLAAKPELFTRRPSAELSQIFFAASASAKDAEVSAALSRAVDAKARLNNGEPFEDLAMKLSEAGTSRLRGGMVGTIYPDSVSTEVATVVFALAEGETTGPVRSKHGFHLYRVNNVKRPPRLSDEQKLNLALRRLREQYVQEALTAASIEAEKAAQLREKLTFQHGLTASEGVWLEDVHGTTFSLRLLHLYCQINGFTEIDLQGHEDAWLPEKQQLRRDISLALLANHKSLINGPAFQSLQRRAAVELLEQCYWREVQQQVNPSAGELELFYEKTKGDLQARPLYTGHFITIPVIDSTASLQLNPLERHQALLPQLNRVNELLQTSETLSELLPRFKAIWPEVRFQSFENEEVLGPVLEPVAAELAIGTRSRAIETQRTVQVLEITARTVPEKSFEKFRAIVESTWREKRLQEQRTAETERLLDCSSRATETGAN